MARFFRRGTASLSIKPKVPPSILLIVWVEVEFRKICVYLLAMELLGNQGYEGGVVTCLRLYPMRGLPQLSIKPTLPHKLTRNMTRALSLILLFAGAALYGQKSFEGTVTYTAKLEGAMAERMADMLRGRLPEKVVAYYLRNKSRVDFGETISITDADAGMVYQLNPALQTYQKSSIQGSKEQEAPKIKVSKTKEKTKILGYNAEKYIIEVSDEEGSVKMEVWATPDLRITESLQNGNPLALDSKVQGLPLRTSIAAIGVDLRIVFLATQINKTPPDPSLFEIPAGYVEEKADQE